MSIPVATINPNPAPAPTVPPGVTPSPPGGGGAPAMQGTAGPPAPSSAGPAAQPPAPGAPPSGGPPPPNPAPGGDPGAASGSPTPDSGDGSGDSGDSGDGADPRPRLIPGSDATQGKVPASPQEQADLQQTLIKAGQMIHGRASRDAVLNSLHQPDMTVAEAIGKTAAQLLMTASQQKQAVTQVPLDKEVLQEAARYVIPELMNLGISAGIFPIKPPAGAMDGKGPQNDAPGKGVGQGTDDYNKTIRMAMLEATKVYGESQLKAPDHAQRTAQAQDEWAQNVQREVQNGTANPKYLAMARARQGGQSAPPNLIQQASQAQAAPPASAPSAAAPGAPS